MVTCLGEIGIYLSYNLKQQQQQQQQQQCCINELVIICSMRNEVFNFYMEADGGFLLNITLFVQIFHSSM